MLSSSYQYEITDHAENDLDEIFSYISLDLSSPQAAENTISNIQMAIKRICYFPLSCPLVKDTYLMLKGYRILVIGNYNVLYIFKDDTIYVMRVFYARRDYEQLLR